MARYTKNRVNDVVGTSPSSVLEANGQRARLWLYGDSGNSGKVYVTWDASAPSATNYDVELSAGAGFFLGAEATPAGEIRVIGSAASQRYVIEEG